MNYLWQTFLHNEEPLSQRLAICLICCLLALFIGRIGRKNIRTQQAQESGKRRLVNAIAGQSNDYVGKKAVMIGWMRVIGGVCVFVFGLAYLVFGAFLK